MFRFSIRELLLVTVIVALALGWWLERRQLIEKLTVATENSGKWKKQADVMAELMRLADWKVTRDDDPNHFDAISPGH